MVTGVVPSFPQFLTSLFIAHRVQQSHCSSIFHRVLLTQALALPASLFVHEKKSQRIYTSTHSAGLELTKLTYTRLEDNLIRHRGDRRMHIPVLFHFLLFSFLSFIFFSFLCFFSPIDLRLSCVCVVIDTTCNIYVVVFLGWQSE